MSTPDFKTLLEGATPGPWSVYPSCIVRPPDHIERKVPVALTNTSHGMGDAGIVDKANAEYIARLSPATMRLVLEALEEAKDAIGYTLDKGHGDGQHRAAYSRVTEAIKSLNGETP